jgi:uncharacterized membrane protein
VNLTEILNSWVFFALLAPLFWAISNFIDKYSLAEYTNHAHDFIFFGSQFSWILFVILAAAFGLPDLSVFWLVPIALGIFFMAACWMYAKALRVAETSQLVISFKLIPVLTVFLAFLFLGQELSAYDSLAFSFVFIGTVLVSVKKVEGAFRTSEGTTWLMGAIIVWSAIYVGVDWALTKITFWHYLTLEVLGNGIAGTSLFFIPRIRKDLLESVTTATTGKYFWFALTKSLDFLGQIVIKKAFILGPSAGLVTVVMQVQSAYAIAIGITLTLWFPHIIKEDISKENLGKKMLGAAIMFIGLCVLFLD